MSISSRHYEENPRAKIFSLDHERRARGEVLVMDYLHRLREGHTVIYEGEPHTVKCVRRGDGKLTLRPQRGGQESAQEIDVEDTRYPDERDWDDEGNAEGYTMLSKNSPWSKSCGYELLHYFREKDLGRFLGFLMNWQKTHGMKERFYCTNREIVRNCRLSPSRVDRLFRLCKKRNRNYLSVIEENGQRLIKINYRQIYDSAEDLRRDWLRKYPTPEETADGRVEE